MCEGPGWLCDARQRLGPALLCQGHMRRAAFEQALLTCCGPCASCANPMPSSSGVFHKNIWTCACALLKLHNGSCIWFLDLVLRYKSLGAQVVCVLAAMLQWCAALCCWQVASVRLGFGLVVLLHVASSQCKSEHDFCCGAVMQLAIRGALWWRHGILGSGLSGRLWNMYSIAGCAVAGRGPIDRTRR